MNAPSPPRLRIGISGHRIPPKLPAESEAPLRATIDRIFATVAACAPASDVAVVSSLAEGADRIAAEAGLAAGFGLVVVLPFERAEYARDFATEASRAAYAELLGRAASVFELDSSGADRPHAYEAVGFTMLAKIDLLVTIWDGAEADGRGGTAQIVSAALAGGFPVIWIDPATPRAMQLARPGEAFHPIGGGEIAGIVKEILDNRGAPPQRTRPMNDATSAALDTPRDRHLFGPGPKRLLALDGGGVRGALTVAFLERIEELLSEREGKPARLGDYFDLVGGTSTGAVIAGALALGYRTEQVRDFYLKLAPFAFKRQRWRIPVLQAKFDARGLRGQIEEVVGDRVLSSPDLITGYCVITKRMDTGSPWILSNNPRAPYWESRPGNIGNKHYPLVNLVRASTAAPHFFDPELLPISRNEALLPDVLAKPLNVMQALLQKLGLRRRPVIDPNQYGLFVDGGVTPHNNPALALFHLATLSPFNIKWPTGPDRLTVVSVGTGTYRPRLSLEALGFAAFPKLAYHALISLMTDAERLVLMLMQWMGECPQPWEINSEIGDLVHDAPSGGKMFRFLRYDVRLEQAWLEQELGYKTTPQFLERLRGMDDPAVVQELYAIGRLAAEKQVTAEHLFG